MEKLLSIDEVKEILGVTKATIYSWTSQNKIPHIKLSKRLLKFRETEIMDWLLKRSVTADASSVYKHQDKRHYRARPSSDPREDSVERIIRNAKEEILNRN